MSTAARSTSSQASLRFSVRLARRFARSSALARAAGVVFLAGMFLLAMFVALKTLTLSGGQVVERDLGRFGASVGYGTIVVPPGDDGVVENLRRAAANAGATDAMVLLSAADVQLSTREGDPREVTLLEAAWVSRPFPDRYVLLGGRWPQRPGEIVVTDTQDISAVPGARLSALGGDVRLSVVGVADDRFARTSSLLAAPGTWGALRPALAERFPLLRAQPVLFWSGSSESAALAAFAAVATARGADAGPGAVQASLSTRDELATTRTESWISRIPAGYTAPSIFLPIGAVLLAFGLSNRRFGRSLHVLESLGIPRSLGVTSLSLAAGAWCLLAACLGAVGGIGVGLAVRSLVSHYRGLPAGPVTDLEGPLLRLMGAVGVGVTFAGLLLVAGARAAHNARPAPTDRPERQGRWHAARHMLAAVVFCATVILAIELDSPADAMIVAAVLTVGLLLLIPEWVDLLLQTLPEWGPRTRLSRRQLMADRQRAGAAVALLALMIGGSVGYLTLLDTMVRTVDEQRYPDVLPGQMIIADRASLLLPPPQQVLEVVERSDLTDGKPRLDLRYLHELDRSGNARRTASLEGTIESILAVDSVDQVEQMLARPLTPSQAEVLRSGGMLVWPDGRSVSGNSSSAQQLVVTSEDKVIRPPIEVPAATVTPDDVAWRVGTSGLLLTPTAQRLNLPMTTGAVMYTGLSASQGRALQDTVARAGLDARTIQLYQAPPPAVPPAALLATAAGLVILVIAASLVATHGQGRTLRGYLGRLISIGLPIQWARHVLLYQQVLIVGLATLIGLLIAIPPVMIAVLRIRGFVLSVPWSQTLILLASIYAATGLAALHASHKLRAGTDTHEHAR